MEEIYIEQTSPKTIFKSLLIIFFIIGVMIGGYIYFHNQNILKIKNVTIELGEKVPLDLDFYIKSKINNINDYELNITSVSVDENGYTDEIGEFKYTVQYDNQIKSAKVRVKDTKSPSVTLKQLTVGVNEDFLLNDFIDECSDLSLPCKVTLKNKNDDKLFYEVGSHNIELKISDKYGNYKEMETTVIVSDSQTLLSEKQNDSKVIRVEPVYVDFDGTITYKYDKAVSEELLDELDEYEAYLDLVSTDYNELRDNLVLEQEILTLYNKYNYIIGFTVRLTYEDGTIEYVE